MTTSPLVLAPALAALISFSAFSQAPSPADSMGQAVQRMQENMAQTMKQAMVAIESGQKPGSISVPSFQRILKENPSQITIVDVRESAVAKNGALPGSINIPFAELEQRLASLPKDKPVVFACEDKPSAGKALEKAMSLRKDLKAYFLDADVSCDNKDSCLIKER